MNVQTLQTAMLNRLAPARAEKLITGLLLAMELANINTVNRAAMFLAQIGEETGSLNYAEEIASGAEYEGRSDLGNTTAGDGVRYKGRSFMQITGRHNYTRLSQWAYSQGLVPSPNFFVNNPDALATDEYVWLGPVWYWTEARPNLNALADAGDMHAATLAINGGLNGLADRTNRWNVCRAIGSDLLPGGNDMNADQDARLKRVEQAVAEIQSYFVDEGYHRTISSILLRRLRGSHYTHTRKLS